MEPQRSAQKVGKSSSHIDQLKETERQSDIFRSIEAQDGTVDFARIRAILIKESQIPGEIVDQVLGRVRGNMHHLGVNRPAPALIQHWLTGLLREQGFNPGDIALQSLELSLSDVEMNIYHPLGSGMGADQNPEASAQRIAARIKTQFACRRIFQDDVIAAHDEGRIELLHLGAVDRPHDVFLTPEYLKLQGLPVTSGAPSAGPANRADVILAHLIRFSHELQNHFAGDIQWGYVNTLLLPYLAHLSETEMAQFVQQMLFEFGQLDVERGGLYRNVVLDFDFDLPRQLSALPATGPGGETLDKTYGDYERTLHLFNEVTLDILEKGDHRANPFHSPQIVYHFNQPNNTWHHLHQKLMRIAMRRGNPSIAFSYYQRNFGPLGIQKLNDPDFLQKLREPWRLRAFSSHSMALNMVRLTHPEDEEDFGRRLSTIMEIAISAHRQKRLFLSRLMAYGNRGPLQFLRHKIHGQPFFKIDHGTQPMQIVGLAEAAALRNGGPLTPPEVLSQKSRQLLAQVQEAMNEYNGMHKLRMQLTGTRHESVAYRFASLDLRRYGSEFSPYVLRKPDQAHPIYTSGSNILAFTNMRWRERMKQEGKLHDYFEQHGSHVVYVETGSQEDPAIYQKIYQEAQQHGLQHLQLAPDLLLCRGCFTIFGTKSDQCPACKNTMIVSYGLCQANFSPVHTWCLGKRSEWKLRHRMDAYQVPVQTQLPW